MFTDTYYTLEKESQGLFKDRGSRFIAFAIPVNSEEEIKLMLLQKRSEYHDARHHCYAWALGYSRDAHRMNDDGEPSGTAGKPIFGQILSHDLTNVLVIVVRYFGGTRLGVRGLIDAYKNASIDSINNNSIIEKWFEECYEIHFEYPMMNEVMRILKDYNLTPLKQDFALDCKLLISIRKSQSDALLKSFQNLHQVKVRFVKMS